MNRRQFMTGVAAACLAPALPERTVATWVHYGCPLDYVDDGPVIGLSVLRTFYNKNECWIRIVPLEEFYA